MLKGLKLGEDNSLAILAGLQSILMMLAINLFNIFGSLEDYIFFPYEILVFIFAQALLLAKRFTNLFNKVEQLSRKLLT